VGNGGEKEWNKNNGGGEERRRVREIGLQSGRGAPQEKNGKMLRGKLRKGRKAICKRPAGGRRGGVMLPDLRRKQNCLNKRSHDMPHMEGREKPQNQWSFGYTQRKGDRRTLNSGRYV